MIFSVVIKNSLLVFPFFVDFIAFFLNQPPFEKKMLLTFLFLPIFFVSMPLFFEGMGRFFLLLSTWPFVELVKDLYILLSVKLYKFLKDSST